MMTTTDDLPRDLFDHPSTLRILRIDNQWRYLTLLAKAHGPRPDSRTDMAMDGFAVNYVLRGRGVYREGNGRTHALTPGTLFQRLPGRRHSTLLDPASDYAELFLVLDRATALQLRCAVGGGGGGGGRGVQRLAAGDAAARNGAADARGPGARL